jgi:hypothetical protein
MAINESNQAVIQTGLGTAPQVEPNRNFETLFKDAAQIGNNIATAYDQNQRMSIQIEADKLVNDVATGKIDDPILLSATEDIKGMRDARDQGLMSDVEFSTKIAQRVKALRANHPDGYGFVVENAVAAAISGNSANNLRRDMLQAWNTEQAKSDASHREYLSFLNQNDEWFANPEVQSLYKQYSGGQELTKAALDGATVDQNAMRLAVSSVKQKEYQMDMVVKEFNAGKISAGIAAQERANRAYQQIFNTEVGPYKDVIDALAKANEDHDISEEEGIQIREIARNFAFGIEKAKADMFSTDEWKMLPKAERDAALEMIDKRAKAVLDLTNHKDWGILNEVANQNQMSSDVTTSWLLKNVPEYGILEAFNKVGVSKDILNLWMTEDPAGQGLDLKRRMAKVIQLRIASGFNPEGVSAYAAVNEAARNVDDKEGLVNSIIDGLGKKLADPRMTNEDAGKLAINIFSKNNDDLIQIAGQGDRALAMRTILSESFVQKVLASGNKEAIAAMYKWGSRNFGAVTKSARDTIVGNAKSDYYSSITFDGEHFVRSNRSPTNQEFFTGIPNPYDGIRMKESMDEVQKMNMYIDTMAPIWKAMGSDTKGELSKYMDTVIDNSKEPTVLVSVFRALKSWITGEEDKSGATTDNSGTPTPTSAEPPDAHNHDHGNEQYSDVNVIDELKGKHRSGQPNDKIKNIMVAAAHDTGMGKIRLTSGKGDWISETGRRKGQKTTFHSSGKALDAAGFESDEQRLQFIENSVAHGANGVGVYKDGSIHIDTGNPRRWSWGGLRLELVDAAIARGMKRRAEHQQATS